jgi:hypothetical protein
MNVSWNTEATLVSAGLLIAVMTFLIVMSRKPGGWSYFGSA